MTCTGRPPSNRFRFESIVLNNKDGLSGYGRTRSARRAQHSPEHYVVPILNMAIHSWRKVRV